MIDMGHEAEQLHLASVALQNMIEFVPVPPGKTSRLGDVTVVQTASNEAIAAVINSEGFKVSLERCINTLQAWIDMDVKAIRNMLMPHWERVTKGDPQMMDEKQKKYEYKVGLVTKMLSDLKELREISTDPEVLSVHDKTIDLLSRTTELGFNLGYMMMWLSSLGQEINSAADAARLRKG